MFINYKNCLTNLANSILKYFDIKTYHETLEILDKVLKENNSKNVVVILYDGLGARIIDKVLGEKNFFNDNKLCEIDSVFPSTTAAATTTVMSGLNPSEHGWIGWNVYLKEIDKTVTLFLNEEKETKNKIKGFHAGYDLMSYKRIPDLVSEKGYKGYYVSPFGEYKYNTLEEMNEIIENICKEDGKKYIYAYHDEPDYSMHEYGTDSDVVKDIMKKIEESTKKLCDNLNDTTVIIIADHGHINVEKIDLKKHKKLYDTLIRTTSIDSRCTAFFIDKEKEDVFKKEFENNYLDDFILLTKEEVLNNELFGDGSYNKHFKDAIGDYLAVAKTNKYFSDDDDDFIFKSHHAGITEDEIKVPVIVIKK